MVAQSVVLPNVIVIYISLNKPRARGLFQERFSQTKVQNPLITLKNKEMINVISDVNYSNNESKKKLQGNLSFTMTRLASGTTGQHKCAYVISNVKMTLLKYIDTHQNEC